jgi:anti-sigma factor RsiW
MNLSDRDLETLSAYLDGEISRKDRERLEARLLEDEELNNTLEQLQRTRTVMRGLPSMRAPRNYYLTPEMVGRKETVSRAFPVLRFASALASVLFILLFLGDLLVPRTELMTSSKEVQVAETIMEAAESPVSEAPQIESQLPEAQADQAMKMAPAEAEAAAPFPESTPAQPSEPAAGLERLLATGVPAPEEESEDAVGEVEESFAAPNLLVEERATDTPIEDEFQPTVNYWTIVRFIEIFLIVVALTTGLAALLLFRRNKIIP